jgi:hypothetical protein
MDHHPVTAPPCGRLMDVFDVLKVFLKLGLTSFGGPIAQLVIALGALLGNRHRFSKGAGKRSVSRAGKKA